eukprot:m51a1_g12695 hypothetical protein (105) ;mRNA; f:765-1079
MELVEAADVTMQPAMFAVALQFCLQEPSRHSLLPQLWASLPRSFGAIDVLHAVSRPAPRQTSATPLPPILADASHAPDAVPVSLLREQLLRVLGTPAARSPKLF